MDFSSKKKKSPYSMDANLLHISYEGGNLEDPWWEAESHVALEREPEAAPTSLLTTLGSEKGDIVSIDGERLCPADATKLNSWWRQWYWPSGYRGKPLRGPKSRGCYETPGGTIMLPAHRTIESLTLDRESAHLKDSVMPSMPSWSTTVTGGARSVWPAEADRCDPGTRR